MSAPNDYRVYLLIDPRDMLPFYAGVTCRPGHRWGNHSGDPASSAYLRIRELRRLGLKCRVRIVAMDLSRDDALEREDQLIALYRSSLLNKTQPRLRVA